MKEKYSIAEELKKKLAAMTDEEYIALWNSPEVAKFENVGPTIEEYLGKNDGSFRFVVNNENWTEENCFCVFGI